MAKKEKVLGDSSYEWKVMNRLNRKTMIQTHGTDATNGAGGAAAAGSLMTGMKFEASSG